ncbi:hypothetical protein pb186bvf_002788 [Paramecium bursaria]
MLVPKISVDPPEEELHIYRSYFLLNILIHKLMLQDINRQEKKIFFVFTTFLSSFFNRILQKYIKKSRQKRVLVERMFM